ncbi:tRNA dihydrouridine synthase DusB [Pleionea mediterranea]|uniref:tRNA-dihydrouridine synthase B n=1 Tax=Pleionea mediterranea TaxID=523701 RepID=A0A316FWP5_9GAMM|nr:tRNA dihydrouridine synthase DusB [Pleionea mediterranea]PWK52969.1 tRNA-U20-dihydrouridine synthase [Pleionea mediterranea]
MKIGPYQLDNQLVLAPMAGVTDRPFRMLCKELGAGMTVSEMIAANPKLRNTRKSLLRSDHSGETGIRSVQIAGAEPAMMAEAAVYNVQQGAQIIDINMGCPAKKVCNKAAGSALMRDPELVERILTAVTQAVSVPVTLKIRTGWDSDNKNGLTIAQIAEQAGIQALAVHGRTRSCGYKGEAEYDTIRAIKQQVSIPVIANGDITSPEKAQQVLNYTGADAIMIGRAAQGRPWIFRAIQHFLETGSKLAEPNIDEVEDIMLRHVANLHSFYGEGQGTRIARKHVSWYLKEQIDSREFRNAFVRIEQANEQLSAVKQFFQQQKLKQAKVA